MTILFFFLIQRLGQFYLYDSKKNMVVKFNNMNNFGA